MPNWCDSELVVQVSDSDNDKAKEQLKEFKEFAQKKEGDGVSLLSAEKFIPYPEGQDWNYDWCVKNWGSKWDLCEVEIVGEDESYTEYSFNTAWSPVKDVILAMSNKFPLLEFDYRYFEMGCGFNGMLRCKAGVVLGEGEGDYFGSRGG